MSKITASRLVALPMLAVLILSLSGASTDATSPSDETPMAAMALISMPSAILAAVTAAPVPAAPVAPTPTAAVAIPALTPPIDRDRDGLFYLNAQINGSQVRFLVDTGATTVTLTPADARRIGAVLQNRRGQERMETASGSTGIQWARLDRIQIGRQELHDLDAVIVSEGLPVSLLGQNALSKFGTVTITGHRLHLG